MRPDGLHQSFVMALRNAIKGVAFGISHERNVQIDAVLALVAVVLGFALRVSELEWLAIIICIGAVLALELVNTALESLTDLASPDFNLLAGRAKDTAAGACLIMSLAALCVGMVIFLPKIWSLLF